jgi:hypothetical protein
MDLAPTALNLPFRYDLSSSGLTPATPVTEMPPVSDPAGEHIRVMEARIESQAALLERLQQSGQDTSDAVRRLDLLLSALEAMRLELGRLAQTEMDAKNGRADILPIRRARKNVA